MKPEELKERHIQKKKRQFSNIETMTYETTPFDEYFRRMPFEVLKKLLDSCGISLNGHSVLVTGCGAGKDVYYLLKYYPETDLTVSDISKEAVRVTMATFEGIKGKEEDIENLSFHDNAFDYCFVSSTLHHLPRPIKGIYELVRVARKGLIINEPSDTWLTRLFTRLGWARAYEEVGNYVYRFSKRDIKKICNSLFYSYAVELRFINHKIPKNALSFNILKLINFLANVMLPFVGNHLICLIKKEDW